MQENKNSAEIIADLERRIDQMQNMGDAELGTFGGADWAFLIVIAIVIPVIVVVFAQ
jgi:hypothetical protein